jgi:excinuclease ABC subunit A
MANNFILKMFLNILQQSNQYLCNPHVMKKEKGNGTILASQHNDMIEVFGARVHNLKNIDIAIPKNKLVVITGISGSGKSSLAFDTIYAEGQRRYMETFGAYARQFIGDMERP